MVIHFLQPYSYEKNIGKAYNLAIQKIPLDDWVCITDQDTLKPPLFAEKLKAILETIDENTLLSCMTNRLRPNSEQVVKEMYNEDSIRAHLKTSVILWNKHKTETKETVNALAGVMLCFKRSLLDKIGMFAEGTISFDKILSAHAKNGGKTLKIALGLYLVHLYRYDKEKPENYIEHLT